MLHYAAVPIKLYILTLHFKKLVRSLVLKYRSKRKIVPFCSIVNTKLINGTTHLFLINRGKEKVEFDWLQQKYIYCILSPSFTKKQRSFGHESLTVNKL